MLIFSNYSVTNIKFSAQLLFLPTPPFFQDSIPHYPISHFLFLTFKCCLWNPWVKVWLKSGCVEWFLNDSSIFLDRNCCSQIACVQGDYIFIWKAPWSLKMSLWQESYVFVQKQRWELPGRLCIPLALDTQTSHPYHLGLWAHEGLGAWHFDMMNYTSQVWKLLRELL